MDVSQAIRELRGDTPQHVFATRLGVGLATVQRWESGKARPNLYRHVECLVRAGIPRSVLTAHIDHETA
jgi:hypothetical protein